MKRDLDVTIQRYFTIIFNALKKEDKILKKAFSKFRYDPSDYTGKGINDLYEHHIQYILFKDFLEKGPLLVYMEDPYAKGKGKCDLTLYDPNWENSLWIEIKVMGFCKKWEFKTWAKGDVKKLKNLHSREIRKYLLSTWIEERKPDKVLFRKWFEHNLVDVVFNPNLFGHFRILFSDGKEFLKGYYTVCLLQVI